MIERLVVVVIVSEIATTVIPIPDLALRYSLEKKVRYPNSMVVDINQNHFLLLRIVR